MPHCTEMYGPGDPLGRITRLPSLVAKPRRRFFRRRRSPQIRVCHRACPIGCLCIQTVIVDPHTTQTVYAGTVSKGLFKSVSRPSWDADADLESDIAVWQPDMGIWYNLPSSSPGDYSGTKWGDATDVPVPGDYDGDGKSDIAVWRPDTGVWYALPSATPGTYTATQWGIEPDVPISPLSSMMQSLHR
jgi:hypothetical protein